MAFVVGNLSGPRPGELRPRIENGFLYFYDSRLYFGFLNKFTARAPLRVGFFFCTSVFVRIVPEENMTT